MGVPLPAAATWSQFMSVPEESAEDALTPAPVAGAAPPAAGGGASTKLPPMRRYVVAPVRTPSGDKARLAVLMVGRGKITDRRLYALRGQWWEFGLYGDRGENSLREATIKLAETPPVQKARATPFPQHSLLKHVVDVINSWRCVPLL